MDSFEVLGAAEKHVAGKFARTAAAGREASQKMLDAFSKLEEINWEAIILDPKTKDTIIPFLDVLERLVQNMNEGTLAPSLLEIFARSKEG